MAENKGSVFIDGIMNLSFTGGVFRFDMVSIDEPATSKEERPTLSKQARIIMSPQAFIQAARSMNEFIDKVEDKGIIQIKKDENVKDD